MDRAFTTSLFPPGHPRDPFAREQIAAQLAARLSGNICLPYITKPYPYQGCSSLCGPAAFLYCLLKDRPDLYSAFIWSLWQTGQAQLGNLLVKPGKRVKQPENFVLANGQTNLPAIDWIAMASLRDSGNRFLSYSSPSRRVAGITSWWRLASWFDAVGAKKVYSAISLIPNKLKAIQALSEHVSEANHVIALTDASMLTGKKARIFNHWIVWEGSPCISHEPQDGLRHNILNKNMLNNPTLKNSMLDENVQLKLFSWGEVAEQLFTPLTLRQFLRCSYGGMVFSRIP